MAFDNESDDVGENEDNDSSSASSSKPKNEKKNIKPARHQTPPRKAKNISLYAYSSSSSKKSIKKGGKSSSKSYSYKKKYAKPDPEMISLQEQHQDSMRLKENNLKEMVRHNKAMEASTAWDSCIKELKYKSTLMDKFRSFLKQGYSKKPIAKHFPEMKMLCKLEDRDIEAEYEDRKPSAKKTSRTKKRYKRDEEQDEESMEGSDDEDSESGDSAEVMIVKRKKMKKTICFEENSESESVSSIEESTPRKRGRPRKKICTSPAKTKSPSSTGSKRSHKSRLPKRVLPSSILKKKKSPSTK